MTKARTLADNYAADINQVSAGVGITGGGTSGTVTITNDMATSINAKGDLVVGTANDTYSRLAVASTAGYVLTVDSAEATGLKWGAPGSSFVGCRLTKSASQNMGASYTAVTFDGEDFDTDGFHDNATNNSRITIPSGKAGKYLFIANLVTGTDPTNQRRMAFYKNGSAIGGSVELDGAANDGTGMCLSQILDVAVGDYVEIYFQENSPNTVQLNTNCKFQASFLGA